MGTVTEKVGGGKVELQLTKSYKWLTLYEQLHEKKERDPAPGAPGGPRGSDMPDAAVQAEAQSRAVPMDTDDIDTLRDFLREATASEPPDEEKDVREAVKRMAAAAETLAKRRKKQ